MNVTVLKRPPAKLYAVNCSQEEIAELEQLDKRLVVDLMNAIRYEVGATMEALRARVLCLGRDVRSELTPSPIRRHLQEGRKCFWDRELKLAITVFGGPVTIREKVLHELTHAFLDDLSNGFPYPYALEEGFAHLMSAHAWPNPFAAVNPCRYLAGLPASGHYLSDSQCISIRELLRYRLDFGVDEHSAELSRISVVSLWLVAYLTLLSGYRPVVRRILRELRAKNIRSGGAAYEWLLDVSEMSEEQLEEGFHAYCTTGKRP